MTTEYENSPESDQSEVLIHDYSLSRLLDAATDLVRHCGYTAESLDAAIRGHFAREQARQVSEAVDGPDPFSGRAA